MTPPFDEVAVPLAAQASALGKRAKAIQNFEQVVDRIDHRHEERLSQLLDEKQRQRLNRIRKTYIKESSTAESEREFDAARDKAQRALVRLCKQNDIQQEQLQRLNQKRVSAMATALHACSKLATPPAPQEDR